MTRRKLHTLPALLIAVFVVMQLCACAVSAELKSCSSFSGVMDALSTDIFGEEEQEFTQLTVTLPRHAGYAPIVDKHGYAALQDEDERRAYESMEQSLFRLTAEDGGEFGKYQLARAPIPDLDSVQIFKVKEALRVDHPEAFWFSSKYYTLGSNAHDGLYIILYSNMSAEEVSGGAEALSRRVASLLRDIPSGLNEYDRELLIHDFIVRDVEYDHAAADNMDLAPEAATVYGALVEGRAVCSGYSFAAKLLLNRVGISCRTVDGIMHSDPQNGHMWNMVSVDGDWYHLDITNNDPTGFSARSLRSYNYFNLTDKAISVTHRISPEFSQLNEDTVQWGDDAVNSYNFPLPECRTEKANFYRRNAVTVPQLNEDGQRIFTSAMEQCIMGGGDSFYVIFPDDMEPDVVSEWFVGFMDTEIGAINARNRHSGTGSITDSYSYAQGATVRWCNVFIFKLLYEQP